MTTDKVTNDDFSSREVTQEQGVSVFAPASIGNVSVGFDVLGLAVKPVDGTLLGDVVTVDKAVELADEDSLVVIGAFADKLPSNKEDNIVWSCLQLFNQALTDAKQSISNVTLT